MTIGEALKATREELGLSKYSFSKGIIDRKFYSKVENNESRIGAEFLIKLLLIHHVSIEDFFNKIYSTYADKNDLELEKLNIEIEKAVRNKELKKIETISQKFLKLNGEGIDYLRSLIFINYFKKQDNQKSLLDKVKNELDKYDELLSTDVLKLFSNALLILDFIQIDVYVEIIIKKANKKPLSLINKKRIAQLCNNYLKICLEKNIKGKNISNVHYYLEKLNEPELLIYKILGRRDYYLLHKKYNMASTLTNVLREFGYSF